MNTLGFVFSILLILSFGFSICLEKQASAQRLRSSYLGHVHATRKILIQCETEFYNSLPYKPSQTRKYKPRSEKKREPASLPILKINPKCACLNLFPLIEQDKIEDLILYETSAKLFKLFYGKTLFEEKPHAEIHFLNAFIQAIKTAALKKEPLILEKIQFKYPADQVLYYKMLKGTKDPISGYPSLLEYIKIEPQPSKICLPHATPHMIAALFGPKASAKIYQTIHAPKAPPITKEIIERLCSEVHTLIHDGEIFDLVELAKSRHKKDLRKIIGGEDLETHVSLKKNVILNG